MLQQVESAGFITALNDSIISLLCLGWVQGTLVKLSENAQTMTWSSCGHKVSHFHFENLRKMTKSKLPKSDNISGIS